MDPQTPSGNGAQGHPQQSVSERVEHLGESAQHLISDAKGAVGDVTELLDLKGRLERNPYGMIAAAVGLGYVLGGGLFTPFTGRLIKLGFRLAALPMVKDELMSMAESALDGYAAGARAAKPGGTETPNI